MSRGNGIRLNLADGRFAGVRGICGTINDGPETTYRFTSSLMAAVFAHKLDELLLSCTKADPRDIVSWVPWSDAPPTLENDIAARLMQRLWLMETGPYARRVASIDGYVWKELRTTAGLYAAAWALKRIDIRLPVFNCTTLRMRTCLGMSKLSSKTGPSGIYHCALDETGRIVTLVRSSGAAIEAFWTLEDEHIHLVDLLNTLQRFLISQANDDDGSALSQGGISP